MSKRHLLVGIAGILSLLVLLAVVKVEPFELLRLGFYSLNSIFRMLVAFILALLFAVTFGYFAATEKWGEKILIPIFDILQSVPTLGFFPAVIVLFISVFQGDRIGVELAAIFLIFSSMVWNMIFAVYESIKSMPREVLFAVEASGLNDWMKFRTLYLPTAIPALVYNSILSWANGWYFLIASEIISLGNSTYRLPGLGAFLVDSAAKSDFAALFLTLIFLAWIIFLMNSLLWKPLSLWSARFKHETFTEKTLERETIWDKLITVFPFLSKYLNFIGRKVFTLLKRIDSALNFMHVYLTRKSKKRKVFSRFVYYFIIFALFIAGAIFTYALYKSLSPIPSGVEKIPLALFFSFTRILVAFIISCIWTVPVAIYLASNKKAEKLLLPLFELTASIPATAFFPAIVAFIVGLTNNFEPAAIILLVTGMQWYLFFNVYGGARSIPNDVKQVASSYGVKNYLYYKRVLLPAILPAFVTGSITAIGGGWNALVVAEFISFGMNTYQVNGIGAVIVSAIHQEKGTSLLVLSLIAMVITIFVLNRLVWDKLYTYVTTRFKME